MLVMQSLDFFFAGLKTSGICLADGPLGMALERLTALIERCKIGKTRLSLESARCSRKFLRYFGKGFYSAKYNAWERGYKWAAHERWEQVLNKSEFFSLLRRGRYTEIAQLAVKVESPTNLLFSFEKMALRDAVKDPAGAEIFAEGLYRLLYGNRSLERQFEAWCDSVESLPVRQSRVFTHPVVTVFGFLAQPQEHIFLKPTVTRTAARSYGFDLRYTSRPG